MKVTYYKYFKPDVSVHEIVDDFGTELGIQDTGHSAFVGAKIFVTGMTFEQAQFVTLLAPVEMH